jgi:hypothetical protein
MEQSLFWEAISPHFFVEFEGSLLYLQEPSTGPCSE